MDHNYVRLPVLRYFVDKSCVIPIALRRESEQVLAQAYDTIAAALEKVSWLSTGERPLTCKLRNPQP